MTQGLFSSILINTSMKTCNCNDQYSPEVSLHAKVQESINAIMQGRSGRVVESCGSVAFVLCADHAHLGSLLYTCFNAATGHPLGSYQAKYSNAHVVGQILFSPVPKIKLPYLVDSVIPGYEPICEIPPQVIPGVFRGEYHYVEKDEQPRHYNHSFINPYKK